MQIRIITLIVLLAAAFARPATADAQMCQSAGNVELTITPESSSTTAVTFTFTNHNNYLVTVDAGIRLTDTDGKTKDMTRTFVIEANDKKEIKFTSSAMGGSLLAPYDCTCRFTVSKCD